MLWPEIIFTEAQVIRKEDLIEPQEPVGPGDVLVMSSLHPELRKLFTYVRQVEAAFHQARANFAMAKIQSEYEQRQIIVSELGTKWGTLEHILYISIRTTHQLWDVNESIFVRKGWKVVSNDGTGGLGAQIAEMGVSTKSMGTA